MGFPFLHLKGGSNVYLLAPDKVTGRSSRFSAGQIGPTFLCQCTLISHRNSFFFFFPSRVHLHSGTHILLSCRGDHSNANKAGTYVLLPGTSFLCFDIYLPLGLSACYTGWKQRNPECTVYKRIFASEDRRLNLLLVLSFLTPGLPISF